MKPFLLVKRLSVITLALCMAMFLAGTMVMTALALVVVMSFSGNAVFPTECAIVFGAAVHKNSTPGPGIRRRVRTATDLYNEGKIEKLYFSGGFGSTFQAKSEAMVMKEVALEAGVPEKDIFIEEQATSTWENIEYTAPMMQNCTSVVGISDRYHLARIKLIAHKQGWGSLQIHPAAWVSSLPFEMWSTARETLGLLYYSAYVPGEY